MKKIFLCTSILCVLALLIVGCNDAFNTERTNINTTNTTQEQTVAATVFLPPEGSFVRVEFTETDGETGEESNQEVVGTIVLVEGDSFTIEVDNGDETTTLVKVFFESVLDFELLSLPDDEDEDPAQTVFAFDAFDATGGLSISDGPIDIPYDTQRTLTGGFDHILGSGEVGVVTSGTYVVSIRIGVAEDSGYARDDGYDQFNLLLDSGQGFTVVPGTLINIYHSATANDGKITATGTFILTLSPGDVLKVRGEQIIGDPVVRLEPGASAFSIYKLSSDTADSDGNSNGGAMDGMTEDEEDDVRQNCNHRRNRTHVSFFLRARRLCGLNGVRMAKLTINKNKIKFIIVCNGDDDDDKDGDKDDD
jgi:hypothetical protein